MAPKILVKERFTDGEIDLSMTDLEDVPVKEIVQLKKAYSLDLSNNRIAILPKNFSSLAHLTKLDLSKNELKSLPEDFGNLSKLKYLDLYRNQLNHLPLSFCKLKELKWLDLKDNPLVPKVAKIAGPCLDTKQCQSCARDIVNFFGKLQQQVDAELEVRNKTRQKQLEINHQKKQEEKKEKKKVKQKQKQETLVQKSNGNINKTKKDKKIEPENVSKKPQKSSFIVEVFKCLLITGLILFLLTSTQMKFTKHVELFTRDMYKKSLDTLPTNLKPYGVQFGTIFNGVHKKTGNIILGVIRYLDKNIPESKRNAFLQHFKNIFNGLVKRISEFYKHFVQTE